MDHLENGFYYSLLKYFEKAKTKSYKPENLKGVIILLLSSYYICKKVKFKTKKNYNKHLLHMTLNQTYLGLPFMRKLKIAVYKILS